MYKYSYVLNNYTNIRIYLHNIVKILIIIKLIVLAYRIYLAF